MTTGPAPATHPVSSTAADKPQWGDRITWVAAQAARRGAVEISHHLIGGMLPQVDAAGRVVAAEGVCMRCGGGLLVAFDPRGLGPPTITGKARTERCIPRPGWWSGAGAETKLARAAFGARKDPAFVGHALAVYARSRQADGAGTREGAGRDAGFDLDRALGLSGDQARARRACLELYPMPTGEAGAMHRAVEEMARALSLDGARLDGARLARVLTDARTAVVAEEGQRAVAAREMEIVTARHDLARLDRERATVQARLDGLLAAAPPAALAHQGEV